MQRFLHISYSIILLVIAVSSMVLFSYAQKEKRLLTELHEDIVPGAVAMSGMQSNLYESVHLLSHLSSLGGSPDVEKTLDSTLTLLTEQGESHLKHESHRGEHEEQAAETLLSQIRILHAHSRDVIRQIHEKTDYAVVNAYEEEKIHPIVDRLYSQLEQHKEVHLQELAAAQKTRRYATTMLNRAMLTAAVVLLSSLVLIWVRSVRTVNRFVAEKERSRRMLESETEKQIQAQEEMKRLAAAIDQAFETVVVTDVEGNIQYVNPAFESLTGYSREEVIGRNPRILKSGRQDAAFYRKMWAQLLRGEVWSGHLVNRKKDGSLFEEEANISPVKNSTGQITNFVAVKRDVSREVSLEKQLRQAMKMEAIGTLAGGIAHDFNNILAAILGFSDIAKSQLPPDSEIGKDLDQVIIAGNRARDLVKQILTFSRQGEEDFKPLKMQPIVKEVLKLLRSSLPSTITLNADIEESCGTVLADPTQLHQVIMNLCANARHAIGDKIGILTVALSEQVVTDTKFVVSLPQLEPGTYLDLEISDTGYGMDGLTLARIFDPFFTTKEKGKGTGLGLAVVHGIIKQHKGEITVASEPGKGSTFHIYLPVIAENIHTEPAIPEDIPGGSERILLVDDEKSVAEIQSRTLTGLGYQVTVCAGGAEALNAYTKDPDAFDLVITDMTMPKMTGTALAQQLLALDPDLPVILCTGFSEAIDEAKAKSLGIRSYIMKPIVKATLAKAVREALSST